MIVKSESRRCSNSHSKQCCSNSHTRRSSHRCWCYHRQARPQGRSIGRRTQYPYIFNFLYTHTSRGIAPPVPLCGLCRQRFFARRRAADAPIRTRSSVVQKHTRAAVRTAAGATTDKRDRKDRHVDPVIAAAICRRTAADRFDKSSESCHQCVFLIAAIFARCTDLREVFSCQVVWRRHLHFDRSVVAQIAHKSVPAVAPQLFAVERFHFM